MKITTNLLLTNTLLQKIEPKIKFYKLYEDLNNSVSQSTLTKITINNDIPKLACEFKDSRLEVKESGNILIISDNLCPDQKEKLLSVSLKVANELNYQYLVIRCLRSNLKKLS